MTEIVLASLTFFVECNNIINELITVSSSTLIDHRHNQSISFELDLQESKGTIINKKEGRRLALPTTPKSRVHKQFLSSAKGKTNAMEYSELRYNFITFTEKFIILSIFS